MRVGGRERERRRERERERERGGGDVRVSSAYILCCFLHARYDVELYQRIEQLIGKKLPLHATVEEEVMSLMERVSEAQRHAKMVRKPNFKIYLKDTFICGY